MKTKHHPSARLFGDILFPTVLLLLLCFLLILQQQRYQSPGADLPENLLIDEDHWNELKNVHAADSSETILLVTTDDEEAQMVCDQFAFVSEVMQMTPVARALQIPEDTQEDTAEDAGNPDTPEPPVLPADITQFDTNARILVICESDLLSLPIDVDALSAWVASGGRLLVAGGLDSPYLTPVWEDLLGLNHQDEYAQIPIMSMRMQSALLAGGQGMEFSDEVIHCQMSQVLVRPEVQVHITTADDIAAPLLWELPYGNGTVIVSGADLMDSKANRGIICACLGRMNSVTVWPVINAAVYCIDDFPSAAPAGFDRNVRVQFGYTVSDFYFNVWWPSIREIGHRYGIPYSCFLIQCYDADTSGPFDNDHHLESAAYFAKLILEDGGEIGIHGYNHQPLVLSGYVFDEKNGGYTPWPSNSHMVESLRSLHAYAARLSPEISLQAYVAPSNVLDANGLELLVEHFENLRVFAGVYIGTPDQMIQEYEAWDNGVVLVPRLTADMQMEDSEWWTQLNAMNFHFVESNYIHPDDILDEERNDGGDFSSMLEGYEHMVAWNQAHHLRPLTISQAAGAVQRYCNLQVSRSEDADGLTLRLNGRIDTGYLLLRVRDVDRLPVCRSGGQLTKIDEGLWLLEADADLVRIEWGE